MPTRVLALAVLVALAFSPAGALAEITIVGPGERYVISSLSWFGYSESDVQATQEAGPFAAQTNVNEEDGEAAASASIDDSVIAPGHINIVATGMASVAIDSIPRAAAQMGLWGHHFEITRPGHARVRWTFVGHGTVQGNVWISQLGQPGALVSLTHEDGAGDVTVDLQPGQYVFYTTAVAEAERGVSFDSSFQVHAQLDVVEDGIPVPALSGSALVLLAAALLGVAVIATRRRNTV